MAQKLQRPEQVRDWLVRRYNNQHRAWLDGAGEWPLTVTLGLPTEADVASDLATVRSWVDTWAAWRGPGFLQTQERRWARLGSQTLPATLSLANAAEVAAWCGQERRWGRATARSEALRARWAQLEGTSTLGRFFDALADYSEPDFERLVAMLDWALANPSSGLYPRQLPVVGVDTKWLETRTAVVTQLLGLLRGADGGTDFYTAMGLKRLPHRARMRVLCPDLRVAVGGLRDIEAPLEQLACLTLRPRTVVIVENRETGAALPDMAGTVAFVGLGNAVSSLALIPWLSGARAVYWGDIDTHGLSILSLARASIPGLRSVLMDVDTLLAFKELAVQEPVQASESRLTELSESERTLFDGLRNNEWGTRLRLEQERIPWEIAIQALTSSISG
jgi:hypothetical protein